MWYELTKEFIYGSVEGLVIDGKVVSTGKLQSVDEVVTLINESSGKC